MQSLLLLVGALAVAGSECSLWWLVTGLLLQGAVQGLCITPLVSTVYGPRGATPRRRGLRRVSTMQQLGSALGVAVTGVIFFGEIGYGVTTAFEVCLVDWPCCRWGLRRSRDFGVVNLGHSMAEENSGGRV